MNESTHHVFPVRVYVTVYALLIVLLATTIGVSFFHLGEANILVPLTIAMIKAGLIMAYFMHLRYSPQLIWMFAGLGFVGLIIMILLSIGDYVSRGGGIAPMP